MLALGSCSHGDHRPLGAEPLALGSPATAEQDLGGSSSEPLDHLCLWPQSGHRPVPSSARQFEAMDPIGATDHWSSLRVLPVAVSLDQLCFAPQGPRTQAWEGTPVSGLGEMGPQPYQELGKNGAGEEVLGGTWLQCALPSPSVSHPLFQSPLHPCLPWNRLGALLGGRAQKVRLGSASPHRTLASLVASTECSRREGWGPSVEDSGGWTFLENQSRRKGHVTPGGRGRAVLPLLSMPTLGAGHAGFGEGSVLAGDADSFLVTFPPSKSAQPRVSPCPVVGVCLSDHMCWAVSCVDT